MRREGSCEEGGINIPNVRSSGIICTLCVYLLLGWERTRVRVAMGRDGRMKWRGMTSPQRRGKGSASPNPTRPDTLAPIVCKIST